ncbi:MAG: epoxyqueuosine reductase QueH [Eubacterium sp.]|nr:epoxyqueuosine reductase QueH [Eubacterium sp.]
MSAPVKRNYQKELEVILDRLEKEGRVPTLLLHSCCAPCSSYVLEYLSKHFRILDYYYNPNITDKDEYKKRSRELDRLIREMPFDNPVSYTEGKYEPELFFRMARGLEEVPEGGERCMRCFELRLREAAREAVRRNADFFTTSLTISPLKNAVKLNEIGMRIGEEEGVPYLVSDFKKKNGFKRSTELSEEYGLYRQNYCGCIYSKREADRREQQRN